MSILTVAFDKTWLDAFREKGVRVVRTLEKWLADEPVRTVAAADMQRFARFVDPEGDPAEALGALVGMDGVARRISEVVAQIRMQKELLADVIRYTTMANFGLIGGNFEVDVEDGEVRYKSYVDANGLAALSKDVIEGSIYRGWSMLDRYGDGLAALIMGFSDVETEIEKAEKAN